MTVVGGMLSRIAYNFSFEDVALVVEGSAVAFVIMGVGYLLHAMPRRWDEALRRGVVKVGVVGQWLIMVAAIWLVMECGMLLAAETGAGGGLPMYAAF
jgi:hypothetical protein